MILCKAERGAMIGGNERLTRLRHAMEVLPLLRNFYCNEHQRLAWQKGTVGRHAQPRRSGWDCACTTALAGRRMRGGYTPMHAAPVGLGVLSRRVVAKPEAVAKTGPRVFLSAMQWGSFHFCEILLLRTSAPCMAERKPLGHTWHLPGHNEFRLANQGEMW